MLRDLTRSELESFPSLEWQDILRRMTPGLRSSVEGVLETQNGAKLSLEECYALANADGDDLLGLLVAANATSSGTRRQHRDIRRQPQY